MKRPAEIRAYLEDYPADAEDVVPAVVEALGLAETLAFIGELFGDAGRLHPPVRAEGELSWHSTSRST
jgi:hypothetical protein